MVLNENTELLFHCHILFLYIFGNYNLIFFFFFWRLLADEASGRS